MLRPVPSPGREFIACLLVAVLALLGAAPTTARQCLDYEALLDAPGAAAYPFGEASRLCVHGDAAYVLADERSVITIFDLADLAAPRLVGEILLSAPPNDLAADGNDLLATVPGLGLLRLDLSDPLAPTPVDTLDLGAEPLGVDLAGPTAYVALATDGLRAVALDLPGGMLALSSASAPGAILDPAIDGDWLYCAVAPGALLVIDASDRGALLAATSVSLPAPPRRIEVSGGICLLTGTMSAFGNWWARAYDVSDPLAPSLVAAMVDESYPQSIAVRGHLVASDRLLVSRREQGLREYRLGPGGFVPVGYLPGDHADAHLDPDRAVLLGPGVLRTGPGAPLPPVGIALPGTSYYPTQQGDLAYTVEGHDLIVLDLADAAQPVVLSRTTIDGLGAGLALAASGPALYFSLFDGGIRILDVTDPTAPTEVATAPTGSPARTMLAAGGLLYTVENDLGLVIHDLAEPFAPVVTGSVALDVHANNRLVLAGDQLLVGAYGGVWIFDVADPADPAHLTTIATHLTNPVLMLDGDRVVLATDDDPAELWRRDSTGTWLFAEALPFGEVEGAAASAAVGYLVQASGTLAALDLAVPSLPLPAGAIATELTPRAVLAGADWVLVSGETGSALYPARCPLGLTASDGTTPAPPLALAAAPNPFNPRTRLSFALARPAHARLQVFDLRGRLVATLLDRPLAAGRHQARWDGRDRSGRPAPAGVYHARLTAAGATVSRKVCLLK